MYSIPSLEQHYLAIALGLNTYLGINGNRVNFILAHVCLVGIVAV